MQHQPSHTQRRQAWRRSSPSTQRRKSRWQMKVPLPPRPHSRQLPPGTRTRTPPATLRPRVLLCSYCCSAPSRLMCHAALHDLLLQSCMHQTRHSSTASNPALINCMARCMQHRHQPASPTAPGAGVPKRHTASPRAAMQLLQQGRQRTAVSLWTQLPQLHQMPRHAVCRQLAAPRAWRQGLLSSTMLRLQ